MLEYNLPTGFAPLRNATLSAHLMAARANVTPNQFRT